VLTESAVTKARIEQFETELQAEREKRRRLEDAIEDIRRERREPFVVPALLDAFIEISKLTNGALEEE
jgi:type II secretory pathway component PulM